MPADALLQDSAQQIANDLLVWVGFGTIVGFIARGLLPGRDPGGAIASVLLGIGGTILGCGVVSYFGEGERVLPTTLGGALVALVGTLSVLLFYKMLGVQYFVDGQYVTRSHRRRHGYSRLRRYESAAYED